MQVPLIIHQMKTKEIGTVSLVLMSEVKFLCNQYFCQLFLSLLLGRFTFDCLRR